MPSYVVAAVAAPAASGAVVNALGPLTCSCVALLAIIQGSCRRQSLLVLGGNGYLLGGGSLLLECGYTQPARACSLAGTDCWVLRCYITVGPILREY